MMNLAYHNSKQIEMCLIKNYLKLAIRKISKIILSWLIYLQTQFF